MSKNELGSRLIAEKKITEQQLHDGLQSIANSTQTLGQWLIDQKIVLSADVANAYAQIASVSFIQKITEKMADSNLLSKVPLRFLRQNTIIPADLDGVVTVITANPQMFQPIDELTMLLGGEAAVAVSTTEAIIDAINRYYPLEGTKQMIDELEEDKDASEIVDFTEVGDKDILSMASEAPIIKLVNHILVQAVKRVASDIHIEPFEKEVRVRYRVDGIMYTAFNPPKRVQSALISRIKIMANMNIAEKRLPQDGRIEIKVADKAFDIRVSVLPTTFGGRVVMRLLDKTRAFAQLAKIGFSPRDYEIVSRQVKRPNGIIYVSGPTGSGKTSTLYSILVEVNSPEVNIITVEDPVEYQMSGVGQVQVNEKIGLTFAAALRSILRQDPNIVMIGETRDSETAQIAIQAALTGHLVLSTIHTNNAPASITRLIDMGIEPFLIASSVAAVIAQRLLRTLCPSCKKVYKPTIDELKTVGLSEKEATSMTFYQAVGCDECSQTGYKGRVAIFEIMEMTQSVAKLTMERADMAVIRKQAVAEGMTLLVDDGIRKIAAGVTTIEEVARVATTDSEDAEIE